MTGGVAGGVDHKGWSCSHRTDGSCEFHIRMCAHCVSKQDSCETGCDGEGRSFSSNVGVFHGIGIVLSAWQEFSVSQAKFYRLLEDALRYVLLEWSTTEVSLLCLLSPFSTTSAAAFGAFVLGRASSSGKEATCAVVCISSLLVRAYRITAEGNSDLSNCVKALSRKASAGGQHRVILVGPCFTKRATPSLSCRVIEHPHPSALRSPGKRRMRHT